MLTKQDQEILDNAPSEATEYKIVGDVTLYGCNMHGDSLADLRRKQAKAIMNKRPRTKVEYVLANKNSVGGAFWECAKDYALADFDLFYWKTEEDFISISTVEQLLSYYTRGNLYRKVETEIKTEKRKIIYSEDGVYLREHKASDYLIQHGEQIFEIEVEVWHLK